MNAARLRLKISTPTEPLVPGRGFYQLEEESLYIQVAPFSAGKRFFSYLESDTVRLDIDRTGRLLFVEVSEPRRNWLETDPLPRPVRPDRADVRFLQFRDRMVQPDLLTDKHRTVLLLVFSDLGRIRWYELAEDISIGVDSESQLSAIWVGRIVDDLAGRQISAHRKRVRRALKSPG